MSTPGSHHLAEELARAHLFIAELVDRQAELRDLLTVAKKENEEMVEMLTIRQRQILGLIDED